MPARANFVTPEAAPAHTGLSFPEVLPMSNRPSHLLGLIALFTALPACGLLLGLDEYQPYCKPYGPGEPPDCAPSPSGSGGAGGAGGGATACEPGATADCYEGPPDTKGVGICKGGTKTCDEKGTDYGACQGAVTPDVESCAATEDESCDGLDCVIWVEKLSAEGNAVASIARDPKDGTFVLAGDIETAITFPGAAPVIPTAGYDGLVARVRPDGSAVWARAIGSAGDQFTQSVAVDAQGNIFIGGTTEMPFTLDSISVPTGKFVAKLDPSGQALWVKGLVTTHTFDNLPNVSVTPQDDVIVSGAFNGSLNLGDGPVNGSGLFIAKLRGSDGFGSKAGAEGFWSHYAIEQYSSSIVNRVDAAGNVYFAGYSTEAITFAGEMLPNAGGSDWIFGKLTSDGSLAWARQFGGAQNDILRELAVDNEGNLIMEGFFNFVFDFVSFNFDPVNGGTMLFKWNTSNTMEWGKQYNDKVGHAALAVDAQSNVAVFSAFTGDLDLGKGPTPAGAGAALFLAKLSPSGDPTWLRTYPVEIDFGGADVAMALTPEGTELTAAAVPATVDFGTGPLMWSGGPLSKQLVLGSFGR
jgi:hypothetical protein